MAIALLDDAKTGGQSQTRAFALFFGGKKRFKDVLFDFVSHAHAGVADTDHDIVAGSNEVPARIVFVKGHVGRADGQGAAIGHRITGVDNQVQQHLLDLAGIGFDLAQVGRGLRHQFDVLANQAAQHLVQIDDQFVQIDPAGLNDLPTGESQQLTGEVRRALGTLLDALEIGPQGGVGRQLRERRSVWPQMTARMLLKSWATPPASRPMLSIFWVWRY